MAAVLGVQGSCWKACCFPAHKLGVKNGAAPPSRNCVPLLIVVFCWLLLVVVVVAPVSGVGCWALLCAVVSFVFVLIRALTIKIMLFTLVINVLVLTKF